MFPVVFLNFSFLHLIHWDEIPSFDSSNIFSGSKASKHKVPAGSFEGDETVISPSWMDDSIESEDLDLISSKVSLKSLLFNSILYYSNNFSARLSYFLINLPPPII
ncbi:hypothetical protein DLM78_21920 [Leptospira stimsonii]|uniref:Uncharacterized protein n=1 Tax=Leptospira stimsonii TaxID=2202203 RepID=A0A8B3CIP0_9LEPT|nr:hypothetical protein DLM78_21920 [Leptospira stimsonii]